MNWFNFKNPMDMLKEFMKTPMIQLLETIQENVMHKLPYYDDFKKAYQEKEEIPLKTYSAKPITEDQKKDINELIKTNKFLFGYRNDIKSIGVLTNIIEYSTFCGDPVDMAERKFGKIGYSMLPVKSKIEHFKDKISQIMNYFYYHPDITREIGAALEKYVDVPNRHRTNSTEMFDFNYSNGDSIIFNKNGIRTVGAIQQKYNKQYEVDYIDYKDKSNTTTITLRENDILGYGNNKGGIISWIFTDIVIDDFTEACLDPKYDGKNRESNKCIQGTPLNMRNNVICTLYEGAKTANPNTQYPELKMCTECIKEDNMSDINTDPESISSRGSEESDLRAPVYENWAPSFSDRSSSGRSSEDSVDDRNPVFENRPSLSSDTSNTTLTDEESKAYEIFKEAVCKASLEEKESELDIKNAEISGVKTRYKKLEETSKKLEDTLKEKDDQIQQLKIDLNKQGRRVIPNIFNRSKYSKDSKDKKKGGKKKSSTKKKRKNVTRRKKKSGKKSKKSRK